MSEPRTFDLRLWVAAGRGEAGPVLERFLADVRELAKAHPDVDPRWIQERRDRRGRPRIRRAA